MSKLRLGEEMYKKYLNTIIRVKNHVDSPWVPFLIESFADDIDGDWPPRLNSTKVRGSFIDLNGKHLHVEEVDLADMIIDLSMPSTGFVNDPELKAALYYYQRPMRQWKRALSRGVLDRFVLRGEYSVPLLARELCEAHIKSDTLIDAAQLWEPNLYPFHHAVESVLNGEVLSCAFTQHYAVSLNKNYRNRIMVYYRNIPIGVVGMQEQDNEYYTILPEQGKHFVEDLSQYVRVEIK